MAALLFDGWTTSPPHRRNLLDGELTEVGIATAYSARSDRYYAVQLFGRPRSMATRFDLIWYRPTTTMRLFATGYV